MTAIRASRLSLGKLLKARSRLAALETPPPSSSSTGSSFITPSDFNSKHLAKAKPGLFRGLIGADHSPYRWPAIESWVSSTEIGEKGKLAGLRAIDELQHLAVDVEVAPPGRGYGDAVRDWNDSSWSQLKMPFTLFLDAFIDGKIPWQQSTSSSSSGQREDDERSEPELVGYVAQQDLFEKSIKLQEQCPPLPHAQAGAKGDREQWRRNLWIGGAGTFTPIHCDPYENLFAQVVGSKRFHIFPPRAGPALHLFDRSSRQSNTSSIPTELPLLQWKQPEERDGRLSEDAFPELHRAIDDGEARHVILHAGDVLYIPRGWFHCVASLTTSASVNAWFR